MLIGVLKLVELIFFFKGKVPLHPDYWFSYLWNRSSDKKNKGDIPVCIPTYGSVGITKAPSYKVLVYHPWQEYLNIG